MKINAAKAGWARRYRAALRKHIEQGPRASLRPAYELGREAAVLGLETLDLAGIHAQALPTPASRGGSSRARRRMIERANKYFAETIVPIEKKHHAALEAAVSVNRLTRTLRRRTEESSASIRCLKRSVRLRQGTEQALKKSGVRRARILAELHRLQKRLLDLTCKSLSTQEDEKRAMSFRLHDEIAQALIAINLRLLTLKKGAKVNTASLKKEIANTQRMVKESTERIDQFTHEFGIQHET